MGKHWIFAGILAAAAALPAAAQDAAAMQRIAQLSYEVLGAVNTKVPTSQENSMRRCRAYMDEARSAEKLGAQDMAAKNWQRAGRGCKQEAQIVCRSHKWAAPAGHCQELAR